jgi:hypothetical protein
MNMNRYLLYLSLLTLAFPSLTACAPKPQAYGFLEGHVTIGPLVPVVREGEMEPTPAPEVYAAREVVVYQRDGKTEVARLKLDANGNYQALLPVGIYVVDINHVGMDSASGLPKEIEIIDRGVTRLDIDIDTGIR